MEISHWISTVAALIVAFGWLVTGYLNRINNIALKRLDYRIKALESFSLISNDIKTKKELDDEFIAKHTQVVNNFKLYAYENEKIQLDKLTSTLKGEIDQNKVTKALRESEELIHDSIRKELRFN